MSLSDYVWLDLGDLISDEVSGTGWDKLLRQLLSEVEDILAGRPLKLRVRQVKEKFGCLRVYWSLDEAADLRRPRKT